MEKSYIEIINRADLILASAEHSIDWSDWLILSLSLISILISRISNYNYIPVFLNQNQAFFSTNKLSVFTLLVNFIFTASFFIKQITTSFISPEFSPILLYAIIFFSIGAIILLKFLILQVLTFLFDRKTNFSIFYHLKYYQLIGLVIFPIFLLSYFTPEVVKNFIYYSALFIYFGLILYREFRLFLIAIQERISFLYIILYLCTLEILPLILVIKILVGKI
ncbi:MAG: DUF4271 domain-containing protein [Putridiphycobacter sp.]